MVSNQSGDFDLDRSEYSHHHNRIRYSSASILNNGHSNHDSAPWQQWQQGQQDSGASNVGWNTSPLPQYQQAQPTYIPSAMPFSYTQGPGQAWTHLAQQQAWAIPEEKQEKFESGVVNSEVMADDGNQFEGSLRKRKLRDVICLGLFVVFLGLTAAIAGYAIFTGDYSRFAAGSTSECNVALRGARQRTAIKNTIFFNVTQDIQSTEFDSDFFDKLAAQVEDAWPSLVYMCFVAVGLSILVTVLLRLFAGVIVWIVVGLFVAAVAVGTTMTWMYYVKSDRNTAKLVLSIVVSVIALIFVLVLVSMRKRIMLVIQLFKEAGKAVHAMPMLLVQPFWTFLFKATVTSIFVGLAVLIETSRVKDDEGKCIRSKFASISRWVNIFAYFWMVQFIIGCQHLVIAGAVSKWFFTRDKSRLRSPIVSSMYNLIRYHLGSVAFGSLIIAIIKFIRYLLNLAKKRLGTASKLAACCLCLCSCCLWCLDKVLQFINRNAYIEIAIYGYAFCPAAKRAFNVIVNNALRIAAINSIGDFVLWLGKIVIVALTGLCGYYIFQADLPEGASLDVEWTLIVAGMVFAYFIAHVFVSTYEMTMDTIFICFCEDLEVNDGVNKPYFMSKGLMKFIKANQKMEKADKKRKSQ